VLLGLFSGTYPCIGRGGVGWPGCSGGWRR
jgi:hypothetical protein